jgi:hypothetical protein
MEANIIFENVKAYNVNKFDVKLGQEFSVELIDAPGLMRWFSDNDAVLSIDTQDDGSKALIKSTKIGKSEIQLQNEGVLVKTLYVETYDHIAVSLNPTVKTPVIK